MAGSTYGNRFKIMTWGESHGEALGVVVDGCPAGLELCEEDIQKLLDRRKPGQSKFTTPRKEADKVKILSGVFEGKTTGTPISMVVFNTNQRSGDYSEIAGYYRPGHADYTFDAKYGFRDYRGGGRSSARETIGRVAAGAIALKILDSLGITLHAYAKEIGGIAIDYEKFDLQAARENAFTMPDKEAAAKVEAYATQKIQEGDSIGGIIECVVEGMMPGIGEPVFDKLDASLGKAMLSIGAVKGFEIGSGFEAAKMTGSENTSRAIGWVGSFNYSYDNRYSIDFNIRADGSSQFGSDNRFAPFWSVGAKWNVVNEDFMKNTDWLSELTLRVSHGTTGTQGFAPYQAQQLYTYSTLLKPYLASDATGATLVGLGNPDLKWQQTAQSNFALEAGFLKGRITARL